MNDDYREERCRGCQRVFYLCRDDDRGQAYCGDACRAGRRRLQKRAARAHHQASELGRQDHRDRMRACRKRRVMDQGSRKVDHSATVPPAAGLPVTVADELRAEGDNDAYTTEPLDPLRPAAGQIICAVCGQQGRLIRFHHLAWSRRPRHQRPP